MKLRHILPLLLLALAVLAGTAWALDGSAPAEIEAPAQVEAPTDAEAPAEALPELLPELTEANAACCVADCYDAFNQCTAYCSDQACFQACRQDLSACKAGC